MYIRKGFSIVEILVAVTLSITFSALIARTINSGVELNVETSKRMIAENKARDSFRNITTALRGTVPLGKCEIPSNELVTQRCIKIIYDLYPIISASTNSIAFFSRNRVSTKDNTHPNLFRVRLCSDNSTGCSLNLLLLSEYSHSMSIDEYVNPKPEWRSPCFSTNCAHFIGNYTDTRVGEVDVSKQSYHLCGQVEIFKYYDSSGRKIEPESNCFLSAEKLTKIKLVVMEANFSYNSPFDYIVNTDGTVGESITKTFPMKATISLPSKSYGIEQ
jgi:hypothetical protein